MSEPNNERTAILDALGRWMRQRPGLEYGNYGDLSAYRSEMRSITKDLHQARDLLQQVNWRTSITADHLKSAFDAYSGRLSWNGKELNYCTGQYFPTEYRRAVCAVLSSALWSYFRENMAEPTGDKIRLTAKRQLGRTLANRWFN